MAMNVVVCSCGVQLEHNSNHAMISNYQGVISTRTNTQRYSIEDGPSTMYVYSRYSLDWTLNIGVTRVAPSLAKRLSRPT